MAYIGNTPADKFLTLAKQNFTTSATTSYTLDSSVSSTQDIALFINSVRQSPVDAYTVSGTALTLTSATAGTDEMYCVYLGKTVGTVVPASNTITNAMMTDDSVGVAELSATGTASSSTFLRGDNSWTAVSGTTINNNADNKVITGSGTANTLEAETNFIYNGTIVGAGADGANADLGVGLHIKTADSGASVDGGADELVVEGSGHAGLSILTGTSNYGSINFGDSGDNVIGWLQYRHNDNSFSIGNNGAYTIKIDSTGAVTKPLQPAFFANTINSSAQSITNGVLTTINIDNEVYDVNADFNTSTYTFTAPVTGKYQISGNFSTDLGTVTTSTQLNQIGMQLTSSNRNYRFFPGGAWTDNYDRVAAYGSVLIDMDANDTVVLQGYCERYSGGGASTSLVGAQYFSWMGGYLVC